MLIVTAIVANGLRSAGRRLFHRAHSPVSALATVVTVAVPVGISPRRGKRLAEGRVPNELHVHCQPALRR